MQVLLTNGDSWTQGDNPAQRVNWDARPALDTRRGRLYHIVPGFGDYHHKASDDILYKFYESDVWPSCLSMDWGIPTYNAGRLGSSNTSIRERTIWSVEYLLEKGYKHILVIVGWSSRYREDVLYFHPPKEMFSIHQVRPHNIESIKKFDISNERFDDKFLLNVIALQNYLDSKNNGEIKVDYLFFNAFDYLDNLNNPYYPLVDTSKWVNNTLARGHFKDFVLSKFNLKDTNNKDYFAKYHPTDKSHKAFAEYLGIKVKEQIWNVRS